MHAEKRPQIIVNNWVLSTCGVFLKFQMTQPSDIHSDVQLKL